MRMKLFTTIVIVAAVIFNAGCEETYTYEAPVGLREKLKNIDTVKLEELSHSKPATVEQATTELTQQLNEPNDFQKQFELTSEQVRIATLANNLGLKVELISPSIAKTIVDEERAKFEAVFNSTISYQRSESGDKTSVTQTASYNAGIEKPLPTGGTLVVEHPFSDSDATDDDGLAQAGISVSLVQPLLRGAGNSINTQSIRIACMEGNIVDAATKLNAIDLLANADEAYWQLFSACKELEVRREQYKLAQDQLEHARKKVASGAAAKIEIVRAEAGVASRLEAVISAENTLENRERDLRRIMNRPDLPLDDSARIIPQTEPHPLGLKLNDKKLIEYALANRMDVIQLEQQLAIDKLNIEYARNAALPDLALTGRYSIGGEGGGFSRSYNNFARSPSDDVYAGLSLSIPLGNEAAQARLHRNRLYQHLHKAQRDELEQYVRQQVQEAISDLGSNWHRILAAQQGVEAAYRDYRVEQSQFQLGVRTSTDVLLAATRLADAQLARIRAFVDYEIAQISLARATGTLLGYDKIVLEPINI